MIFFAEIHLTIDDLIVYDTSTGSRFLSHSETNV